MNESLFSHLTGKVGELGAEVEQDAVVVGTARSHFISLVDECLSHSLSVGAYLLLIVHKFGSESFAKCHSFGRDNVFERAALHAGEYGRVEERRHLANHALRSGFAPRIVEVLAEQNDTATRAAEGFVSGRSDDVSIFHRVFEQTGSDETCRVSHINHKYGAHLIGDFAHAGIIPFARVGTCTTNNQFWLGAKGFAFHLVVVDKTGIFFYVIFHLIENQT